MIKLEEQNMLRLDELSYGELIGEKAKAKFKESQLIDKLHNWLETQALLEIQGVITPRAMVVVQTTVYKSIMDELVEVVKQQVRAQMLLDYRDNQ